MRNWSESFRYCFTHLCCQFHPDSFMRWFAEVNRVLLWLIRFNDSINQTVLLEFQYCLIARIFKEESLYDDVDKIVVKLMKIYWQNLKSQKGQTELQQIDFKQVKLLLNKDSKDVQMQDHLLKKKTDAVIWLENVSDNDDVVLDLLFNLLKPQNSCKWGELIFQQTFLIDKFQVMTGIRPNTLILLMNAVTDDEKLTHLYQESDRWNWKWLQR